MNRRPAIAIAVIIVVVSVGTGIMLFRSLPWNWSRRPEFDIAGMSVNDFAYMLQYESFGSRSRTIEALASTPYDLLIMDLYYNDTSVWTADEIATIKKGVDESSRKTLLCYISIGEAESYRPYWNDQWDADGDGVPDEGAPAWLDVENPDWPGNYKVHYWDPSWQRIIYGENSSYIDQIIAQGFDGAYLDIIDAYEYYEEQGVEDADQRMVDFVAGLSAYAKSAKAGFLIVPQNGENLARRIPEYLDYVDGIGREDIYTVDNEIQDRPEVNSTLSDLALFVGAGKFVLDIEYPTDIGLIADCYQHAAEWGFLCYVGPRALDRIQVNPGFEPD
ncbi:MAG: MJ1477/TM1410 family putative glycoside hydrolase [Candidatus Thorarchaeota archaeon]